MKNAKEIKEKEMKAAEAEMKKCKVSVLCIRQCQAKNAPLVIIRAKSALVSRKNIPLVSLKQEVQSH